MELPNKSLFRIGEVAKLLGVETHVVRFWQQQFPHVKPSRSGSGRFLYSRSQVEQLERIRRLLHEERMTIEGARKAIRTGKAKVLLTADAAAAAEAAAALAATEGSDAAAAGSKPTKPASEQKPAAAMPDLTALRAASRELRRELEALREHLEESL
ncbi:MAG: MerR family transcriptional regulator [Deltaproteobacteria bacterium]|nr:MerR family transcriptional regulator [Deltaproteobacteria bacterium]